MNKLALIAAFTFLAVPVAAHAEHHETTKVETTKTTTTETKEVTLKDGTKVVIDGETVSVVGADGAKTTAPDGEHELADGTKVTVKGGKLVHPADHEAPAKH